MHTQYAPTIRSEKRGGTVGVREGLLALLGDEEKHGYQLKMEFDAATRDAWPLNIGQVYTTLQRLERDGLVEGVGADDEGRRFYRRTAAGAHVAIEWFTEPIPRNVATRDDVSMKLLMAMVSHEVPIGEVIDHQRVATMKALQDYTRLKASADQDDLAWLLHLDRLVFQAEAELRWLSLTEDRVGVTGPPTTRKTATHRVTGGTP
jgi:DNA-binding PadR family transcriptional regulator